MTLTIELTAEEEKRLRELAVAKGINEAETARQMLAESLAPNHVEAAARLRGGAALVGRGKYAHVKTSSEEFARRKQEEIALEERNW